MQREVVTISKLNFYVIFRKPITRDIKRTENFKNGLRKWKKNNLLKMCVKNCMITFLLANHTNYFRNFCFMSHSRSVGICRTNVINVVSIRYFFCGHLEKNVIFFSMKNT